MLPLRFNNLSLDKELTLYTLVRNVQLIWNVAPCKIIRNLESRKHLPVRSGFQKIFDCGIRNPTLWNPQSSSRNTKSWKRLFRIWNPLRWNLESSTWDPESTSWNPESKTVMDYLTWGEKWYKSTIWCTIHKLNGTLSASPLH